MNKGDNDTLESAISERQNVVKTHRHALLVLHSVARFALGVADGSLILFRLLFVR
jgi:hypothetical protein